MGYGGWGSIVPFDTLQGKTMASVEADDNQEVIIFTTVEGEKFSLHHDQDCCEFVSIEDICGDLQTLVGTEILLAEEVSNFDAPPIDDRYTESYTWTFYHLRTVRGLVTLRWFGESNGYYSESVDLHRVEVN